VTQQSFILAGFIDLGVKLVEHYLATQDQATRRQALVLAGIWLARPVHQIGKLKLRVGEDTVNAVTLHALDELKAASLLSG
jgi:hypothetical protein